MTTKGICRFCGRPGQGVCYECAIDSIEWHNKQIPIGQAQKAGAELVRRSERKCMM